jgi:DNA-binding transcriptional ArsR family regulator
MRGASDDSALSTQLDNIRTFAYYKLCSSRLRSAWANWMQNSLRRFKAGIFHALAHPTRIAIIELLRDEGEVPVSTIHERLGLEQANISQHLAVLRSKQIVVGRKDGNQVFYSLRDAILGKILDLMRQYFQVHLNEALEMLEDMNTEENPAK